MATEVKVDLDLLDTAKRVYDEEINALRLAMQELKNVMDELRSSAWQTEGSRQLFMFYDGGWQKGMEDHIQYLEHLRDCLKLAQAEFHSGYDRQNKLY